MMVIINFFLHILSVLQLTGYKFFKIDWTLNKLVLFQKIVALVLNFYLRLDFCVAEYG